MKLCERGGNTEGEKKIEKDYKESERKHSITMYRCFDVGVWIWEGGEVRGNVEGAGRLGANLQRLGLRLGVLAKLYIKINIEL